MGVSNRALPHWEALVTAMDEHRPACRGDERFTLDRENVTEADLTAMHGICGSCPIRALCNAYAAADKPSGGYWAGRYWGRKERSRP